MNDEVQFLDSITQDEISREWDAIAHERDSEISSNADASFAQILEPWILNRTREARTVIDVGCGTGRLTSQLGRRAPSVLGVDPSVESIEIARKNDSTIQFHNTTLEHFVTISPDYKADLVVANMVLMDALDLNGICHAITRISPTGRIVATITHPAFWPLYWGYADNQGFNYKNEIVVQAPFKTNNHKFGKLSTHVHRPLETYLDIFRQNGIKIIDLEEMRGPEPIAHFPFPRFLGIEAFMSAG
ncbi:class I SAM-dependent methyltransferase [Brevibacterium linens]|uniref:class I SAM-dependent methyltransferase n=1 Tax=Brevibacterium linens TaxID=1703 RepID=UPI000FCC7767|nr:class I SAM-dependent methyltransferase [Brevibacterium linens]AZU01146.1 hypothetical protein CXR29_10895 [Brevibacterium linens]